ncbi:hypothetical protein OS493_011198 [Desmophyllum pertusum]|uniref:Uncharacterized protein n=1 Tax=Desmophyllum pertusum TaxID=174260 RepID=A0A9W9Z1G1_9CNID|nr:hypothetical protein OS493_011198 [Desmophyllum pertusum]
MNTKKARRTFTASDGGTSVLRVQHSTVAILCRLFTLWIFCCGFVAGTDNGSSISSAVKSSFPASTSLASPATSVYSSHSQSVQVNSSSENVNSTSTTTPNSLLNETSILIILQSSNIPVVGSTEPIILAQSFITTAVPSTQSVARSVRSLFDASSLSITGFTEPLTLALFTRNSLSRNQNNASSPSSSIDISSATSAQSSSIEVNASSSLQIITTTTQNVAGSSSDTIDATKTALSNYATVASSLDRSSYTVTNSSVDHSSPSVLQSDITESLRSTTLVSFTSISLSGHQSNASSPSSSTNIRFATSVESSSIEVNATSSLQIITTTTTQNVAGSSSGTIDATKTALSNSVTMASSFDHNSYKRTNSSVLQSDVTESLRSTTLVSFTSISLPGNQSKASSPSSSSGISSASSAQSSSIELNASSSLQIITNTTQNVGGSSSDTIDATKTALSNSVTMASSLDRNSYTRTNSSVDHSSPFVLQSDVIESLRSTTSVSFTSILLPGNQSQASLPSSSTDISSANSAQSSSKEGNYLSSLPVITTTPQTVTTVVGSSSGTFDATERVHSNYVTMASSYTSTPSLVVNSSTHIRQSDVTESFRSTQQYISSEGNHTPQATNDSFSSFQLYNTNGAHIKTLQTHVASHNSSTMSKVVATVYSSETSSFVSVSHQTYIHGVSPSITVSGSSQPISDNQLTTSTVVPPSGTFVNNSSLRMSSLPLNQSMYSTFGSSTPSDTIQRSVVSMTSSHRVSVTTTRENISTAESSYKQTLDASSVVMPFSSGSLSNTSVNDVGHSSTALSQVITMNNTKTLLNPSSRFSSTTSASMTLGTSAKQASLSQTDTVVNSSRGSPNSMEPPSTSKTALLPTVSIPYSNNGMSSNTVSVLMTESVSRLATEALSPSLTVPQETSGRSGSTPVLKQSMGTSSHSGELLSSLPIQSKDSNSISTQLTATTTKGIPHISITASISSSMVNMSLLSSASNLTSASQTTSGLPSPSSEHLELSTKGFSHKNTLTTQDSISIASLMSQSRMELSSTPTRLVTDESALLPNTSTRRYLSSTLNVTKASHLLSTGYTINSTAQVPVTASSTLARNSSMVNRLTPTLTISKFVTPTPYISSSAGETDLASSLLNRSIIVTVSTTRYPAFETTAVVSTGLDGTGSMSFSSRISFSTTTFLSSTDLLQSTSKPDATSTPGIISTSRYNGTATVSNSTHMLPSVSPVNSSHMVSHTSHRANESSVFSTTPFQNQTGSFSQHYSSKGSNTSTLLQKASTSLTLTASIIRTSFSARKITSDSMQPTLTLSTLIMATLKSDSAASQLVSTNPRETTATGSTYAMINSSIVIKTESSFSVLSASSGSEPKQTYVSSKLQGVSLVTLAETASRTTNHSVSVHERSSYLHENSSLLYTSRVESSSESQRTTSIPFVNTTTTLSFQPHSPSNVPVVTTMTSSSSLSISLTPQLQTSSATTTLEISHNWTFSSAVASSNASTTTSSQNVTRISKESSVKLSINSTQESRASLTTVNSLSR